MSAETIPWKTRDADLVPGPVYLLRFDKDGRLTSPRSLEALLRAARDATDVVLFSHGWNNDFAAATSRYDRFFGHLDDVVRRQGPPRRPWRPVHVGVIWPSTALVMPDERGPDIAGGTGDDLDAELAVLADDLGADQVAELRALLADPGPGEDGAARAAQILATLPTDDETGADDAPVDGAELLEVWRDTRQTLAPAPPARRGGIIDDETELAGPDVAGLDPFALLRDGIRLTTVRLMKDRGGRVGARGSARSSATWWQQVPVSTSWATPTGAGWCCPRSATAPRRSRPSTPSSCSSRRCPPSRSRPTSGAVRAATGTRCGASACRSSPRGPGTTCP